MSRILITGASRGIGRAIALKLAAAEVMLFLHGRDENALAKVAAEVEAEGATTVLLPYDLERAGEISALLQQIGTESLDVLINNAGIAVVKPLHDVSLGDWQRTLAVNVTAPFLLTQKLAPQMRSGSTIVNILSVAAKTGFPGWSSYSMSKFALEGFSQAVREELRPRGVRVVNIYPGATATDIWQGIEGEWPRDKMLAPEEVAEAVAFALSRPPGVLVENISVGSNAGTL